MTNNFECPYCGRQAMVDLSAQTSQGFGLVVCDFCAGYVGREGGEWHSVTHEDLAEIHARAPYVLAAAEAQRVSLVQQWLNGEGAVPTIFAAVLTQMARHKGMQVCRWRAPSPEGPES